jgi:glycosyltransferase involved in cell wall biosynthesis
MDDCSPDNTPEVAKAFVDKRIKYIRNDSNVGHLKNYNKGISLSSGKYVWLISADDLIRTNYILDRYVTLMESNPQVGFVFCPAIELLNDTDHGVEKWTYHGPEDCVFEGKKFVHKLLGGCCIPAAGVMVRKECYENVGLFPTDLVFGEDWYMWSSFAFQYDVGYLSEPMVSYRKHDDSITNILSRRDYGILITCDFSVLWRIREEAIRNKICDIAELCIEAIHDRAITKYSAVYGPDDSSINRDEARGYIAKAVSDAYYVRKICALLDVNNGDYHYGRGDFKLASMFYRSAFMANPYSFKIFAKYVLVKAGKPGALIRSFSARNKRIPFGNEKTDNLLI